MGQWKYIAGRVPEVSEWKGVSVRARMWQVMQQYKNKLRKKAKMA